MTSADNPLRALTWWFGDAAAAALRPIGGGSSFSGAGLWQVEHHGRLMVLRRWPTTTGSASRIDAICRLQRHLAADGIAAPAALLTDEGAISYTHASALGKAGSAVTWTLSEWLPGVADFWSDPRPAKLRAALTTLARAHQSAASFPAPDQGHVGRVEVSPAMTKRASRLEELRAGELADLNDFVNCAAGDREKSLALETLGLIQRRLTAQWRASFRWRTEPLPLQWRLGDVWHDHLLFTGEQVTGLIDFGAAAIDSPAGDVARLLGSLVGDDCLAWRQGVEAYCQVRSLSAAELAAVDFFDSSGTLLAAFNWVHWLFRDPLALGERVDRAAAFQRLERLLGRLRAFEGGDSSLTVDVK